MTDAEKQDMLLSIAMVFREYLKSLSDAPDDRENRGNTPQGHAREVFKDMMRWMEEESHG